MARVLLCDDNKTILALLEIRLNQGGHVVVGKASDGNECLKLYQETKPQIVLLDITMPNMDGKECLQGLMKIDSSAKIIILSAIKNETVVSECLKIGALLFVSKTSIYNEDEFKTSILSAISGAMK